MIHAPLRPVLFRFGKSPVTDKEITKPFPANFIPFTENKSFSKSDYRSTLVAVGFQIATSFMCDPDWPRKII